MPIRPDDPNDGTALVNQILARLRALERTRAALPDSADPLQTFENGSPLGDTRFLDFGAGINATLVGDDYVLVTGAGAAGCTFDAIVDGSITVSDPEQCLFKGIGEALAYLYTTVGLTERAFVLVRGFNGTYTETADFVCSNDVHLIGTGSSFVVTADGQPIWNLATFGATNLTALYISDMNVTTGNKSSKSIFGSTSSNAPQYLWCDRVSFTPNSATGAVPYSLQGTVMRNCTVVGPCVASTGGGGINYFLETQFRMLGFTYSIAPGSGSYLYMDDVTWWGSLAESITLPQIAHIRGNIANDGWSGSGTGGTLTLTSIGTTGRYDINCTRETVAGFGFIIAFSSVAQVSLHGAFGAVTVGAPTAGQTHHIEAKVNGALDITGPAVIDTSATTTTTFRGNSVTGHHYTARLGFSSGAAVAFVGADRCNIDISHTTSLNSGTAKALSFDATSDWNLVCWNITTGDYPAANSDLGTNNVVLPSTPGVSGAPSNVDYLVGTATTDLSAEIVVGTTPGGELGGTWASPTVDATHSGSAHADFIAKAFFAAKGDLIGASANDTPIILTVGTDNFVLVADSTTASGLAWKNITTLLSPDSGWGSITNVTPDKIYDADATTVDELADVLGTLIATLVTKGYLSA